MGEKVNSKWINNIDTIKTMHFIAVLMVVFFLISIIYQVFEINVQLRKDLITPDIYERLVTSFLDEIAQLVMIVVMYFFGKEVGKKQTDEKIH
ncbi:hypothetical protein [Polaribacter aestuariivivens]|uniref:hypothetical protein n=1 Tax=Polaribacter aestuariivivens TaxID=2304626 RepID=UPI003F499044